MDGGLRPQGISAILDAAIRISTRHWRPLVSCVFGFVLPVQVVSAIVFASIAPESLDIMSTDSARSRDEEQELLGAQFAIAALSFVSVLLATAACFTAVTAARLSAASDWRASLGFAARRLAGILALPSWPASP